MSNPRQVPQSVIDAELLERMARIARGLPGHVVSVDGEELVDDWGDTLEPPPESQPMLRIDGVAVVDIIDLAC